MMKSIPQRLHSQCTNESATEGLAFYQNNAVLNLRGGRKNAEARVASKGRFQQVNFQYSNTGINARCSCFGTSGGQLCSHAVAVILKFFEKYPDLFQSFTAGDETTSIPVAPVTAPKSDYNFDIFLKKKTAEAQLQLSFKGEAISHSWQLLELNGKMLFSGREYALSNVPKIIEGQAAAGGMQLKDFSLKNIAILQFLHAHGELKGSNYILNRHLSVDFLHMLSGTDILSVADRKALVSPQMTELALHVTQESPRKYKLTPGIDIDNKGFLPADDMAILIGRCGLWTFAQDEFYWLPLAIESDWAKAFLMRESFTVSSTELKALQAKSAEEGLPFVLHIEDDSIEVETEKAQIELFLKWNAPNLEARLSFRYGNDTFAPGGNANFWQDNKLKSRNTEEEEDSLDHLYQCGFGQNSNAPTGFLSITEPHLIGIFIEEELPALEQEWSVFTEPKFNDQLRIPDDLDISLNTSSEDDQWIDLSIDFEVNQEKVAAWSDVLKSASEGRYVLTETGQLARVSQEHHEMLQRLSSYGKGNEGKMRFSRYHSLAVADIVEGQMDPMSSHWLKLKKDLLENTDQPPTHISENLFDTLRPYQKEGVSWLQRMYQARFNGILADEMGLGKTIQSLSFIEANCNKADAEGIARPKTFIVCPKSLVENWHAEAQRFVPNLRVITIHGASRDGLIEQIEESDIILTSYALMRRDVESYKKIKFDTFILDEAQNIKNRSSQIAMACREINSKFKLLLSGTPVENSIHDIWSLFDFLLPGLLGHTKTIFKQKFAKNDDATQAVAARIRPFILRRIKNGLLKQLPPKQEQIIYCELTPIQKELYAAIHSNAQALLDKSKKNGIQQHRFEILSTIMRLRQLCCHPFLVPNVKGEIRMSEDALSGKLELLKELFQELINSGRRALIFSQFTGALAVIREYLEQENITYEYMDGSTKNRYERVVHYNENADIPFFLLSLKTGGSGLNLTGADTVIHFDQWWNPMVEDQATDRAHRIGQTKTVTAIKLITRDTIEEKVLSLQTKKRQLFKDLFEGSMERLSDLTESDLDYLLN